MVSPVRCERDSYRLVKRLSTGGMGIVWEARASSGKRRVVIKEPLINNDHDQIKIERLLVEAAVLRTINDELISKSDETHQLIRNHVVRYLDQLTDPGRPLLVLEFLEGLAMSQVYRNDPLPEKAAVQQILILLRVIKAIHSKGVIHRDISPSNIILTSDRGLVLIDFGTAVILQGSISLKSSQTGRVVLKRGFSAPELLEGRSGEVSDIFSAGATMFYALTGKNPGDFMDGSRGGLTKAVNDINPGVSAAASDLIRAAMSPNPEKRFQSATDMISAIETQLIRRGTSIPTIAFGGIVCELNPDFVDIGRKHSCDGDCAAKGHNRPLQIRVADPQSYLEKHHARIWVTPSGQCSIEDLRTVNRTAIKRGKEEFRMLAPFVKEKLEDSDIVALAYNPRRGPYVTMVFHNQ